MRAGSLNCRPLKNSTPPVWIGFREEVQVEPAEAECVEETEDAPWPQLPPLEAMALVQDEGYAYVDVR